MAFDPNVNIFQMLANAAPAWQTHKAAADANVAAHQRTLALSTGATENQRASIQSDIRDAQRQADRWNGRIAAAEKGMVRQTREDTSDINFTREYGALVRLAHQQGAVSYAD